MAKRHTALPSVSMVMPLAAEQSINVQYSGVGTLVVRKALPRKHTRARLHATPCRAECPRSWHRRQWQGRCVRTGNRAAGGGWRGVAAAAAAVCVLRTALSLRAVRRAARSVRRPLRAPTAAQAHSAGPSIRMEICTRRWSWYIDALTRTAAERLRLLGCVCYGVMLMKTQTKS